MTGRPRGFIYDWNPQAKTLALVNDVKAILRDYSDIVPLTLRQIFYIAHSEYGYEKTEQQYKRLCEAMNKARRAEAISMDAIRDDGLERKDGGGWDSPDELISTVKYWANNFRLNRQEGQDQTLFIWCEAQGMVPQLAKYARDYSVEVLSSGGFDSVTTKHNLAKEFAEDYPNGVEILHIGDHDPSGVHMHNSLDEDLTAFVEDMGGSVQVTRLAVTPEQIRTYDLPTAPRKRTDKRSFIGETTQAEALPPRTLRAIVREAIEWRIDDDVYQDVLEREQEFRDDLRERFKDLM